VIEANETEKQLYTPAIRELLRIAIIVYSYHATDTLTSIKDFIIDYQPIQIEANPLETANLRTINKLLGIEDEVIWLQQDNPDISEQEAIEYLAKIKARANKYNLADDFNQDDNATV